jgi:cytosine/uracil/thiamine/allantoin permease
VDDGVVYVRDPTVVIELVVVPISAVVAATNIAVAVIHTTIVANIAAPKTAMPAIAPRIVAPVSRCPQRAGIGSCDPNSRNPVITGLRI